MHVLLSTCVPNGKAAVLAKQGLLKRPNHYFSTYDVNLFDRHSPSHHIPLTVHGAETSSLLSHFTSTTLFSMGS
jgi:hypothetical protein